MKKLVPNTLRQTFLHGSISRRLLAPLLACFLFAAADASIPLAGTITPIEVSVYDNSTPVEGIVIVVREHPTLAEVFLTTDANGKCSMNYVNNTAGTTWVEVEAVGVTTTPSNYELCRHTTCSSSESFDDLEFELD